MPKVGVIRALAHDSCRCAAIRSILKVRLRRTDAPSTLGLTASQSELIRQGQLRHRPRFADSADCGRWIDVGSDTGQEKCRIPTRLSLGCPDEFPSAAGEYCLINELTTTSTVDGVLATRLLGIVNVEAGTPTKEDATSYLRRELSASAKANLPANVQRPQSLPTSTRICC